ncbi:DUF3575 domain-containing protein [Weeksellaceae bacterium TAE3-ERU29]|nr:DUF3575 domain-containing protein [Weeksellaceae bacterium TAE3-ERU29]
MKKLILLAGLCLATGLSAQVQVEEPVTFQETKLNIVKTNVLAYAFRNLNVSYERVINQWFSISGGINYVPKGKIPFIEEFDFSNNDIENIRNANVSNVDITIEPRFYFGKGYGKGFYLTPYYRHSSINLDNIIIPFKDENDKDISLNMSGNTTANSVGLMIGSQWFLGEKQNWVLDWWIVGAHVGVAKVDFNGKTDRILTKKEQKDLEGSLNNFDVATVEYKAIVNENGGRLEGNGLWPGLRAGLAIGYRF